MKVVETRRRSRIQNIVSGIRFERKSSSEYFRYEKFEIRENWEINVSANLFNFP